MSAVYYNEFDKFAAAWLRELMSDGLIPIGDVDERNIIDVKADDLDGYSQCHFFAGIGGWAYALDLAGWEGPVWTGSCPCQPLSGAGQRKGHVDERHLWPAFHALISQCKPPTVFGEQVASKDGREWLSGVRADLEGVGYAIGAADLCAASVGAPHIRQRLWWVAHADGGLGDPNDTRPQGRIERGDGPGERSPWAPGVGAGWLPCADGKARRAQPGIFPLVDGFPNRVGTLRGAGNAIVPALAAEFVMAFMEAR
jgi:DNA (cytosine-5)-methyltransferase 1